MKAWINVFTPKRGYSSWCLDLGFTLLPKYQIKKNIQESMSTWFKEERAVFYVSAWGSGKYSESRIIRIELG